MSESFRMLWVQVVLQAKADLENEPIGSVLYDQAAAFFISRGEWAVSRATVADCLGMHPDELRRCGERWIAERRQHEGLPPVPAPATRPKAASAILQSGTPPALPRLQALPAPDIRARKPHRKLVFRSVNPFDPSRVREVARAAA
jgi:hypothetical protein